MIYRYVVSSCLATVSSCSSRIPVNDVANRLLIITDLIPRTSYNISIRIDVINTNLQIFLGEFSSPLSIETAVPKGECIVCYIS